MTVTDTDAYYQAVGGAIETYGLTACNQYPANGAFYNANFTDQDGTVSPSWSAYYFSTTPTCNFDVTTSVARDSGILGVSYVSTVGLYNTSGAITASGGYKESCIVFPLFAPCTTGISVMTPSQNFMNEIGLSSPSGAIKLLGAVVTGSGLTATCSGSGCLAAIASMTASSDTIKLSDAAGHTGTILLTGGTASGGLTASCPTPPGSCITAIEGVQGSGDSIIVTDAGGHSGAIVIQ